MSTNYYAYGVSAVLLVTPLNEPTIKPYFIAVSSLASLAFIPRTTKSLKLVFVDFFLPLCLLYDNRCSFRRAPTAGAMRCET